jgi:glycosyltransferase involved in cell wall biosynthesis
MPLLIREKVEAVSRPDREKLRIVHVVSSLKVGGMEQFALRIANAQQRAGHAVSVLAVRGGPLLEEGRRQGVEVSTLDFSSKGARLFRAALFMARFRPDVTHAHNFTAFRYALLGKRLGKSRLVLTMHGRSPADKKSPGKRELGHLDAVVAVSRKTPEQYNLSCNHPGLSVIHNGVDMPEPGHDRGRIRRELGLEGRPVGIIVARMDHLKGHDVLLRSLALLEQRKVPLTFLIAGDGPERERLESLAQSLGLGPDRVRFLGFRSDVPDLLRASDFFVLPSLTEGLPLSVLEAMSHRLPVVVTPVGGVPELVNDREQGLWVPVSDPAALAEAMATLARDEAGRNRLGMAAYQHALDHFSFEKMLREYEDLYYRCAAKGSADSKGRAKEPSCEF